MEYSIARVGARLPAATPGSSDTHGNQYKSPSAGLTMVLPAFAACQAHPEAVGCVDRDVALTWSEFGRWEEETVTNAASIGWAEVIV